MSAERRQYLRVIFEETIQVSTDEWTDPIATGLDLSLNGVRLHCEYPLSEGEEVTIEFKPGLAIVGVARWCWPIEWYYQAAVQFMTISLEEQESLREYITDTTGEEYPDYVGEEEPHEEEGPDEAELDQVQEEVKAEAQHHDHPHIEETELQPQSFAGNQVALVTEKDSPHTDMVLQYLTDRTGFRVHAMDKQGTLWPMLRENALDLVLLNQTSSNEDEVLSIIQRLGEEHPDVPFIVMAGPISLEDRLHMLSLGAADVITRPTHLSSVAQSILLEFYNSRPSAPLNEDLDSDPMLDDMDSELDLLDDEF